MLQQFIDFGFHHWELILTFFFLLIIVLVFELHQKMNGVPSASVQQTTLLINHNDGILLDIRDNNAFKKGHILGAINITQSEIESRLKEIIKYKEKPVILIYNLGQPHHKVSNFLKKNGFTDLYHLKGGISGWQNAGLPLVKK